MEEQQNPQSNPIVAIVSVLAIVYALYVLITF